MSEPPIPPAARVDYVARFNGVVDYIDSHLSDRLDLRMLASVAHVSPWHFHRLFQAMMGETVAERVRRRRLEVAAQLLLVLPPVPVQVVALDAGFGTAEVFSRTFKLHFGVTPTAWRQGANLTWIEARRTQMRKLQQGLREASCAGQGPTADDASSPLTAGRLAAGRGNMTVQLKTLPAMRLAYMRRVGAYGDPGIGRLWERFLRWALHNGLHGKGLFVGVGHDSADIAMPERCRYDACIVIDSMVKPHGEVGVQQTLGGLHACTRYVGSSNDIYDAWLRLYGQWLPDSGYQPDDKPCIEVYGNDVAVDAATGVFTCELCLPIRPL